MDYLLFCFVQIGREVSLSCQITSNCFKPFETFKHDSRMTQLDRIADIKRISFRDLSKLGRF